MRRGEAVDGGEAEIGSKYAHCVYWIICFPVALWMPEGGDRTKGRHEVPLGRRWVCGEGKGRRNKVEEERKPGEGGKQLIET